MSLSTFLVLLLLIVIIVMGVFMFKFYNEKTSNTSSNLNTTNQSNEKASIIYENLTEKIYNQIPENQIFVIQNVVQNTDGTFTFKGRIYEDVNLTSISANEYNSLKSSGKINLFGESFSLGEYDDFIPGYVLKDSNGYGFYVTDEYELWNFNDCAFVKGTDKYYMIILDKDVEFIDNVLGETGKLSVSSFEIYSDYDFINVGFICTFDFDNGKISKVTLG